MTNYVFIGDVHSQYSKFSTAIEWVDKNLKNYHIIQGGDLFDSRCDESDSTGVYRLVKQLNDRITVINSNHLWKLYRVLTEPDLAVPEWIKRTLSDFDFNDETKSEMLEWLAQLPYGIAVKDVNDNEYRICHAYWSSKLYVPQQYQGMYKINLVSQKVKGQMLYGISRKGKDGSQERVVWWDSKRDEDFIRVSFHYHTLSIDPKGYYGRKHLILDACCGNLNGLLAVYDANTGACATF